MNLTQLVLSFHKKNYRPYPNSQDEIHKEKATFVFVVFFKFY